MISQSGVLGNLDTSNRKQYVVFGSERAKELGHYLSGIPKSICLSHILMISLNSISQEYLHNLQICKSFWWRIYDVWTDWKRNKSEIFRLSPRLPILMNTWYLLAAIQDVWRRHLVFFLELLLQIWNFRKVTLTSLSGA